ncbi:uncharacterized protein DUF1207 [Spirosoma oryzae]|uniref:Uncharacterized protein DUF1207 n=2 Tax=Spirosoma oryzae TaxID=1469603 RepID=A0A2T0THX8_9BACT|nr:uncharacterized protein DUF1207 [Spirosoma oryzae]
MLCLAVPMTLSVLAQQAPKTTSPTSRTLTPAEQRQKEKIDREVQRERQIRAEWLQKQREYEARKAEKERQRQAKKAEREGVVSPRPTSPPTDTPVPATTVNPAPTAPAEPPAPPKPSRREERERRKRENAPAVVAPQPTPAVTPAPDPVPAEPAKPARVKPERVKPERVKRSRVTATPVTDSAGTVVAGVDPAESRPRKEFLPRGHLFEPILLDPLEAQTYGSVLPLYLTNGERYVGSIVPFAFGFNKPFYRRTTAPGRSEEIVLDLASFTQFEVYFDQITRYQRRQIMNNDYKVSIQYNLRRGANNYRFRVYHLSSHLGDDYIYRNRITAPSTNSVNYEQLDAMYSRTFRDWRVYGGLGVTLRKPEERKPLSAQFGAFYKKPSQQAARLVGGVDVKFFQETEFRPGIHAGVGVEVGRTANNLTFLAETYSGFRPYSQYENQTIFWLGVGVYLNPF